MQLTVNGEQRNLKAGLTQLDQVVEALGHHPKLVVVEFIVNVEKYNCFIDCLFSHGSSCGEQNRGNSKIQLIVYQCPQRNLVVV